MTPTLSRRSFLSGSLAAGASLSPLIACRGPATQGQNRRLFEISLAQWSLHRALFDGQLDALDFPSIAREDYGIYAVEYVNSFYRDHVDDYEYWKKLKRNADRADVRSLLIMIDGEGELGDADKDKRHQAVQNHVKWIEAASYLGCHAIRVNAGGVAREDAEAGISRVGDSLAQLARIGADVGISVIVENHGGLSSNGSWLARAIEAAEHPGVGTLPDFGNFRIEGDEWYDRYRGMEELMPFAKAVSAKSNDFDEDGNEVHSDYRRMMKIVLDSGYRGYVGVEYEGSSVSEFDGIHATKALLERVREECEASGCWS